MNTDKSRSAFGFFHLCSSVFMPRFLLGPLRAALGAVGFRSCSGLICGLLLFSSPSLLAWGEKGHRISASLALRSLPPGPRRWFEGREDALLVRIVEPDHWKRKDRKEGPRHFLNAEPYGGAEGVPKDIQAAMKQVGHPAFEKLGVLPWIIQDRYQELVQAFREGDPERVVAAAGHLGHYVGDAQVPLHSTLNHDGQQSDQRGVHRRWETGLVERFVKESELKVRSAQMEPSLGEAPFQWLVESFALMPKVLADDRVHGPTSSARGGKRSSAWGASWALQGPSLKQRLQLSGLRLGDLIFTAWVEAGRPVPPARIVSE